MFSKVNTQLCKILQRNNWYDISNNNPHESKQKQAGWFVKRTARLEREVKWIFRLMTKYGSIEFARKSAHQLAGAALREFYVAYGDVPDSENKSLIQDIVLYMIERDL